MISLVLDGIVVHAIRGSTADFGNAQAVELHKITSMLASAIANLSVAGNPMSAGSKLLNGG